MKIELISQPLDDVEFSLGEQLRNHLSGNHGTFDIFIALVAFVKFSGVSRIYEALEKFKAKGGATTFCAGIDHHGTSKQGLALLKTVVDRIFVYHDESPERRTFHPKVYIFEDTGKRAVIFVGSGNMTAGGLFTNYEIHTKIELNLSGGLHYQKDVDLFSHLLSLIAPFLDASNDCVLELTEKNMPLLAISLPDENEASESDESSLNETNSKSTGPMQSSLFGKSSGLPRSPKPDVSFPGGQRAKPATRTALSKSAAEVPPPSLIPKRTPSFWKLLSGFDVSLTGAPGQMIIPIEFQDFFEPLDLTKQPDAGGKGRQWEREFAALFMDHGYRLSVEARFIVYEPKTTHPRENNDCRFTFRSRDVLSRLRKGDILIFRPTTNPAIPFEIERLIPADPQHKALAVGKTRA